MYVLCVRVLEVYLWGFIRCLLYKRFVWALDLRDFAWLWGLGVYICVGFGFLFCGIDWL